jgi:glycosyltransferase involved in cell wall biosynthesis
VSPHDVLHFTDSESFGGAEQALLLLIEHLDPERFRSSLLVPDGRAPDELVERARELGADVQVAPPMPLGLHGAARVPALARQLRRGRPAVFHAHLSWPLAAKFPLAAAVAARVPAVVASVQLVPSFTPTRPSYVQGRLLAAGIGQFIAVSRDVERRLVETFGWPPRKIVVIHNGTRLEPRPMPREAREGEPIVLTVARLVEQKGLGVLLDAAAHVPARFVVVGDGPERAGLVEHATAAGIADRVSFLGHRTDVRDLLDAADVFVLPSLYEGTPLAVLEAMAAGKAIVATAIAGTDELVADGESALLVPPRDAGALAGAIRRLLDDPALRARLGETARRQAEAEFGAGAVARRVAALYERLLARR